MDLSNLVKKLTRRERSVAGWLVEGKTNGEIAKILGVSEATAKYHVANILAKLGVFEPPGCRLRPHRRALPGVTSLTP
ncbi:MAG: helix-turn-helix transcriptional regulator [Myxococcales bacterium]